MLGLAGHDDRAGGRLARADRLANAAAELEHWIADAPGSPRGGDLAADVVALAAAALFGNNEAVKALAVILRSIPDTPPGDNPAAFLRWVSTHHP